jgi:FkbH-like protein
MKCGGIARREKTNMGTMMSSVRTDEISFPTVHLRQLAIAATFTAEPLGRPLAFWMAELGLPISITFAPYNQVFQQLLDPGSQFARNNDGVNIVLIRMEDWIRSGSESEGIDDLEVSLERNAIDLIDVATRAAGRSTAPLVIGLCPDSPGIRDNPAIRRIAARIARSIAAELGSVPGLYLLRPEDFELYPVTEYHDPARDQIGHIPYTPLFFAALGTILARKVHALLSPPRKVIVLDCDNTLWKGIVGEEGIDEIKIPSSCRTLQQFMADLASKGFLLCLCSKNDEPDVLAVFDRHPKMILKRDDLVAWRVNWQPKSENLRSLAQELNLGLDSFIFIDDNPVECAEVQAACPEVVTLRVPSDEQVEEFLSHVWAFDRLFTTSEDRQRTALYKKEADRARLQNGAPTIGDFLKGLNLRITISTPAPEQLDRVAQLTQRTNQFNFTTVRRNQGEIHRLADSGLECWGVEVRDRFGEYGLVGVMVMCARGEALEIDTCLLSCRVLGRGVEHKMLNELGEIARRRQLPVVAVTLFPTPKNQPARDFLEGVAATYRREIAGGWRYEIPAEVAATVAYNPGTGGALCAQTAASTGPDDVAAAGAGVKRDSGQIERIATELFRPRQVLDALHSRYLRRRVRTALGRPPISPRTKVEAELAAIWAELLQLEPVGIEDDYFDLGGTSLLAVDLFARIEQRFGKRLPLSSLMEASTIKQLASVIIGAAAHDSLVLIRDGDDRPPLFLVHDGDGETMLYRNLALCLERDQAVYGIRPHSRPDVPMAHTGIAEMAALYIDRMRSVQPEGPYLIGGMCAGGVIAFEIALQLQAMGEKVSLVAIIDAADAAVRPRAWQSVSRRLHNFSSAISHDRPSRIDRLAASVTRKALRKAKNLGKHLIGQQLKMSWDAIRLRLFRYYLARGYDLPRLLQQISVRTVYLFAEKNYRPSDSFNGELLLFRATRGVGDDEPYVERYADPLLGWGRRATRGVRVYDVPGGHSSMLQEPHVRILGELLRLSIARAFGDRPPVRNGSSVMDRNVKGTMGMQLTATPAFARVIDLGSH